MPFSVSQNSCRRQNFTGGGNFFPKYAGPAGAVLRLPRSDTSEWVSVDVAGGDERVTGSTPPQGVVIEDRWLELVREIRLLGMQECGDQL